MEQTISRMAGWENGSSSRWRSSPRSAALVEVAVASGAHGMDSATVGDHVHLRRHEGCHAPFSLALTSGRGGAHRAG